MNSGRIFRCAARPANTTKYNTKIAILWSFWTARAAIAVKRDRDSQQRLFKCGVLHMNNSCNPNTCPRPPLPAPILY